MKIKRIKSFVSEFLSDPPRGKGRIGEAIIMSLIVSVCALLVARSYTTSPRLKAAFCLAEQIITSVFLLEYLLRMWVADKKLRHLVDPYSLIDLVAILPLILPGTYFFQVIRIFRFLRILRFVRYLRDEQFFFGTISRKTLVVIRIIFTVTAIVFVASGLIYYAEHRANPAAFGTLGDAIYFAIVTMATVGYGDITPITTYGRWMTVLIIFSGIILLPWQIKDLIEQIVISYTRVQIPCTKCGLEGHDNDAVYCRRCASKLKMPANKDRRKAPRPAET